MLVGVGREPNVEGLNLEAAGVKYDARDGVHVDDRLQTANSRIFAAGPTRTDATRWPLRGAPTYCPFRP